MMIASASFECLCQKIQKCARCADSQEGEKKKKAK